MGEEIFQSQDHFSEDLLCKQHNTIKIHMGKGQNGLISEVKWKFVKMEGMRSSKRYNLYWEENLNVITFSEQTSLLNGRSVVISQYKH